MFFQRWRKWAKSNKETNSHTLKGVEALKLLLFSFILLFYLCDEKIMMVPSTRAWQVVSMSQLVGFLLTLICAHVTSQACIHKLTSYLQPFLL